MYDVAHDILEHDPFIERAAPLLERLRDASHETVILGKRQGDSVIYLHVIESRHPIRYTSTPGEYKPLYSSATGKALLGNLKEPELRDWLDKHPLPAVTSFTITDQDALVDDILQGRRAGYFVSRGENVSDVWAVSALLTVNRETLAIAIAGPRHRVESNLAEYAQLLVATCSVLSRQQIMASDSA